MHTGRVSIFVGLLTDSMAMATAEHLIVLLFDAWKVILGDFQFIDLGALGLAKVPAYSYS